MYIVHYLPFLVSNQHPKLVVNIENHHPHIMALFHLSFALLISLSFGLPGDGEEYHEIQQEIEQISKDLEIGNYFNRVQNQVELQFIETKILMLNSRSAITVCQEAPRI